ncbi:MAG TPA: DUF748 domain-containing protein [Burkholderiaceae bacterium]|nr:DUF748 domain-containing protein [Burkholderiaceae bacterium]
MAWLDTRWRRIGVVIVTLVALFGVVGAFAIPAAARWGLETVASRELGRTVRLDGVSANPYTLRVTLKGLTVEGVPGDNAPLLTVREASLNASITSLLRLAPVLEALAVDGLTINIVRLEPQRFNISDIIERLQARPKSDEPARFSVHNIEFTGSALNFDDRVTGGRHAASEIRIGIPFLSNLPVDVETTVQPVFAGRIDGTPFNLMGETRPFHESRESSIAIKLEGLDIQRYLAFSPVKLDFEVPSGRLNTDLHLTFRQAVSATKDRPGQAARTLVSGKFEVSDFALAAPAGASAAPLAGWKSVTVSIEEFEPLQRRLVLADVVVDESAVTAVRDDQGSLNWLRFIQHPVRASGGESPTVEPKPGAAAPPAPFAVTLKHATVRNSRVRFVDNLVGRFEQDVVNLQAEASGLTTARPDQGRVRLSADIRDNGSFSLDGDLGLAPLGGRLKYAARDVRLVVAARYLANVLTGTLDGSSDLEGVLEIGQSDTGLQLALRDIELAGKNIKVRGPGDSGATLDIAAMKISGGALDLTGRSVTIDKLAIDAPRVLVRRLRDGSINWQQLMKANPAQREAAVPAPPAAAAAPWTVRMKEAEVAGGDVVIEDMAIEPAVKLRASALAASVKNVVGDGSERAEFSMRTRFGSGGTLSANGNVRWDALAATVRLDARNLDVAALRPYVAGLLNATLAKAELSGRGTVALAKPPGASPVRLTYNGTARLSNLHALDSNGENDLLKWQVLDLNGVDVKAGEGPPLVSIGKVTLSDFYARVIVSEQGRLNLVDIVKREGAPVQTGSADSKAPADQAGGAVTPAATVAAATQPAAPDAAPRPTIRIGAVEIVRGNVNFTDNFIKPNYTANMTGLGGTVTTLASDSTEPATMSLEGKIDDDAPLEIGGRLNPLAPTLFLDVEGRTKGVDLPRLTPYSVKYAGYTITKGKLSMDVKYKVEDQKLQASNHLFLDQLTFGEKVDSPTATKLPVLLAVSLLKNTRGEIDINLPISGSLNDPKFSVGGIIVQVIVNLLTKVITAPFALLASAFGGGEELGYVEFAPGIATLGKAQVQRLDTLAKALNDRPGLKLDIIGRVEPAADTDGVRRAKYESKLRAAKVRQLTRSGGDSIDPATVTITDLERPALVATVYSDEKIPDKPRNVVGMAKTIPAPEMEQLILKNLAATPDDLRALATARAAAVRNYLENNGKVSRERLFQVEPKLTAEGIQDKGAPTRVDFSLK